MANSLHDFTAANTNWRHALRANNHRTWIIIGIFLLIYLGIGLLIDMYLYTSSYPQASLAQIFRAIVTFQLFPIATSVTCIIAVISLLVTYSLYDKLMLLGTDYHEITPQTAQSPQEQQLYNVVEEMKIAAGLKYIPRVFIIDADYMNAFASGYSEKSAMVAITRGLIQKLNRDELQAVMAHELSHIRHLDIKLTLTASLLANLTIMVLDVFFYNIIFSRRRDERSGNALATIIILLRYLLPIINICLLLYLSRTREYMADAGCIELMRNNQPLASALLKIQQDHIAHQDNYKAAYLNTPHENVRREAYIFDPTQAGIKGIGSLNDMFSTHPSTEDRLAAIGFILKNKV
ncbi:MAG: zinc metalloprotease HtpX [Gammaproteobacteria bacterium RIFCSPHIGHO2_12_FULL_41_20]|nr:MAG: zinc metalloprotease HtpX [Gammaproteobacteria bacterium RIFCSPHIGHO2_12_FULL_41_20]